MTSLSLVSLQLSSNARIISHLGTSFPLSLFSIRSSSSPVIGISSQQSNSGLYLLIVSAIHLECASYPILLTILCSEIICLKLITQSEIGTLLIVFPARLRPLPFAYQSLNEMALTLRKVRHLGVADRPEDLGSKRGT